MASNEESESISQFTSTGENTASADMVVNADDDVRGESWADTPLEIPYPDVLSHLKKNGMSFTSAPFWSGNSEQPKLVKNLSVYFSVDSVVTSLQILEAFDAAGIDIDDITSIQWRASNRTWIVSFDSQLAKETALEVASIGIGGATVFLGDCENRLVLVKIYEAPNELPDTALIGRLSHYGRVLSFRRDKIAQFIDNGVRTARMTLYRHIPNVINLAGEFIRIWYPSQPKTCRNCGSPDHLVKDCNTTRCFNCEKSGHRLEQCTEGRKCTVCLADDHQLSECPFIVHSANVENKKSDGKDGKDGENAEEKKKQQQQRRERAKKRQEEEAIKQRARMQMEKEKGSGKQQASEKVIVNEKEGEKSDRDEQQQRKQREEKESDRDRGSERERQDRREFEKWKEVKKREREREDRRRDRDRDYDRSRHDYRRDWSKRRDSSEDNDDDDPGWTVVRRRRRYDYK